MTASALATAGGIVFGGTADRYLFALNNENGKLLWETRLNGDISGAPITFEVGGRQYVAVGAGGRIAQTTSFAAIDEDGHPSWIRHDLGICPAAVMPPATLHIVNGDSAAGSLAQALGPQQTIVVQHDVLSCGPMPRTDSLEQWKAVREQYWGRDWGDFSPFDRAHELMLNTDALRYADGLCLWMGSGLSDQLLLPSTVHLLQLLGIEARSLSTIQFSRHPEGSMEIVGLGMLAPEALKVHPAPEALSPTGIAEAEKVWMAFTASEPDALIKLQKEEATVLPSLRRALKVLIERYPDADTGLNYMDWELLRHTRMHGPRVVPVIANTMVSNAEHLDPVGDMYLMDRMERLADTSLPYPALELTGDPDSMRECTVKITAAGEEILAGRKDFVNLNGIDDWVGGVHLDSKAGMV